MNNAGKVAFLPRGEYDDYNEYEILDFVSNEDGAYVSRKIKQSEVAPIEEEISENWQPLLLKPNPEMVKRKIDMKSVILDSDGHICINPLYIPWGDGVVTEKEYNITYTLNGGITSSKYGGFYPKTYKNTASTSIPNSFKDNYIFTGWTGSHLSSPTKNYVIPKRTNGEMTLEANWEQGQTCNINYELNGGEFKGNYQTIYTEGSYYNPPVPVRDGYIFTGWTPNGIKRSDRGDKTLVANWVVKNASNPMIIFYPHALWNLVGEDNQTPPNEYNYLVYDGVTYQGEQFYITPKHLFTTCKGINDSGYGDYNRAMAEPYRITVSKNKEVEIYFKRNYRTLYNLRGSAVWDSNGSSNHRIEANQPMIFKTSGTIFITVDWTGDYQYCYIYGLDDDVTITQIT